MIVLDAGVVVSVGSVEDSFHRSSREAVSRARQDRIRLVLPVSAYSEALVHPVRQGKDAVDAVERFVSDVPLHLHPIDIDIARLAARLRAVHRALRLPDALVIATGMAVGADEVITTDARWPMVDGIVVRVLVP